MQLISVDKESEPRLRKDASRWSQVSSLHNWLLLFSPWVMVIIALGNGHYDLKILRSLFRAKKNNNTSEPQLAHWLPDTHPCLINQEIKKACSKGLYKFKYIIQKTARNP